MIKKLAYRNKELSLYLIGKEYKLDVGEVLSTLSITYPNTWITHFDMSKDTYCGELSGGVRLRLIGVEELRSYVDSMLGLYRRFPECEVDFYIALPTYERQMQIINKLYEEVNQEIGRDFKRSKKSGKKQSKLNESRGGELI